MFLNVNDNKVFSFGHSDGSDGTFALDVYKPSSFAGFVCYNSMLSNIFANNIYLKNAINRPLYLVHSNLDDIRPIEQTRLIVNLLDSIQTPLTYKEYIGYQHYDKHLQKDLPYSLLFINTNSRNPFSKKIYWETDDYSNNSCDWIKITKFDTALSNSNWHIPLNTVSYDKRTKSYSSNPYPYYRNNKSASVSANCINNTIRVQTSRVNEIELLISPIMLHLENPIHVFINGKSVFNAKIAADKSFTMDSFTSNLDRTALWVASLKLKVE
jgi:hypothetical protein